MSLELEALLGFLSHGVYLLQINLIAPPRYVMTTTTLERTEGLSVLNQAMAAIKEKIEEKRGVFNIQMEVNDFIFFHNLVCL